MTGLSVYFIGYVLFEVRRPPFISQSFETGGVNPVQQIPCNIILKKTTPQIWLPSLTVAWGVVATLMGIVHNFPGFLVSRFFLGVTEAGLFPGVVYYFSMWYKRRERQYRISLFFSGAALAGAFGGILAYGIGNMRGIVWEHGWRWIFILVRGPSASTCNHRPSLTERTGRNRDSGCGCRRLLVCPELPHNCELYHGKGEGLHP
ncbi:MFS transporter [Candidatus Bathyarchaeota archaeon]|nr:MFS transporter [Candidatus Bathyarchaeota archaeon]